MKLVLIQPQLSHEGDNIAAIRELVLPRSDELDTGDLILLPEHVDSTDSQETYLSHIAALARDAGCHVVGGSHHQKRENGAVNAGAVVAPTGDVIGYYQKLRPYAQERTAVHAGAMLGEIDVAGRRLLVLICADFWFADLFQRATRLPDLVLVPALSVTRKSSPGYSRSLWRHMAISRAYEYGAYVGISDWGHPSTLPLQFTCGVGGFTDPTTTDSRGFFRPIDDSGLSVFEVDFEALDAFRRDRVERGFFWKKP